MAKPEAPRTLHHQLADWQRRLARIERNAAFGERRGLIAQAGGLHATPLLLTTQDSAGWISVTSGVFTGYATFGAGSYPALWCIVVTNGNSGDMSFQIIYPSQSNRVVAASATFLATDVSLFGGQLYRIQSTVDADLRAATAISDTALVLQAKTSNSGVTNKFRFVATGWGVSNV